MSSPGHALVAAVTFFAFVPLYCGLRFGCVGGYATPQMWPSAAAPAAAIGVVAMAVIDIFLSGRYILASLLRVAASSVHAGTQRVYSLSP
jgi:hypothetical protein